jgi:hypothetical protein
MRNPVEVMIDGQQYTFCQLPPKRSLKLMTRIIRIIGAPLGAALNNVKSGQVDIRAMMNADIDFSVIVSALCDRLDENEVESIVDELLSQVLHAGKGEVSKQFDALFGGRLPHLFKVLAQALKVEYGDFLAGMPDLSAFMPKAGTIPARST